MSLRSQTQRLICGAEKMAQWLGIGSSSKGPGLSLSTQLSVSLVTGDLTPASGFHGHRFSIQISI